MGKGIFSCHGKTGVNQLTNVAWIQVSHRIRIEPNGDISKEYSYPLDLTEVYVGCTPKYMDAFHTITLNQNSNTADHTRWRGFRSDLSTDLQSHRNTQSDASKMCSNSEYVNAKKHSDTSLKDGMAMASAK